MFSDVFGKAASVITDKFLENPTEKITDVSGFRTKGMKATNEQALTVVDGEMCAQQDEKLRFIRSHMESLELSKLNLESLILSTTEKHLPQLGLVMTVPGIQSFAAIDIISEIGVDMSVFSTSKHLCSWAGLTPQNNESAGKKKTTRISRVGAYIKPLLAFVLPVPGGSLMPKITTLHLKASWTQKSNYRYRQDATQGHLQYAQEK